MHDRSHNLPDNVPSYSADEWRDLLAKAQHGDQAAIGVVLERYRNYLRIIAQRRMSATLRRRVDASDLVQQTLFEAHQGIHRLLGADEPQWRAALRQILRCNLANAIRDHFLTAKRCVAQERPLDIVAAFPNSDATPSVEMSRTEQSVRFLDALSDLPADQAEALTMRYLQGCGVDEIAGTLGRSRAAAAGLLKRGLQQLRTKLGNVESGMWL